MATEIFQEFQAEQVTDAMLVGAAQLFGEHYGIWGTPPEGHRGALGKPGRRVRMSASRLREQCLPVGAQCSYVSVTVDGVLAGNAFGCRWMYNGQQVCWVTQLVVHRDYRERRLATRLLEKLRKNEDEIFGIMSSHPAACMALSNACTNIALPSIPLDFAGQHAAAVLAGSPISYVREAKLRGSLFSQDVAAEEDRVSLVDSGFFVDHEEPLSALEWLRDKNLWSLGGLPDGHEFILVFQGARRHRSRSSSSGRSRQSRG
ncbi:Acyl-CoA N-acyltransferase [Niveomyces insectorum RCEF 264]|uniref:Acyl-CoA N-acyltransferase n=1 Tax=Niveomyces insectorum RCEF 264 TaxID=1081102 RepID=A0A167ZZY1_9HYPO|nr:Acyl-CoA N-acyltransferase [Niveomyces insectorum RCEF 264]